VPLELFRYLFRTILHEVLVVGLAAENEVLEVGPAVENEVLVLCVF
jgi:hypothetical protein